MASCRLAGHRPFGALAARNRIGGQNFAARQPCNVRPAARAFWRNWPINTVHVGNRSRCGAFACGCGSHRPGLGASATLHAGQPTSVRMRCGSHRLNVGRQRVGLGSAAAAVRFAFGLATVRIGSVPRYLGQVSVRSLAARNRPGCHRGGCGATACFSRNFPATVSVTRVRSRIGMR
jgi:hypothetical protein